LQNFGGIFVDTGQSELEETLPEDLKVLTGDESDHKLSDELEVIHTVWLKECRREEAVAALGVLGVEAIRRQHYFGLPDRDLNNPKIKEKLRSRIAGVALEILDQTPNKPVAIFTMGEAGCDGHSDHLATHEAVLAAQGDLSAKGIDVEVLALSRDSDYGDDEMFFEVEPDLVLRVLSEHRSQMPITFIDGELVVHDEQAWEKIQEDYGQFFERQVFGRVSEGSASSEGSEAELAAA
jgi:LmbE family N-acetylglucosaminyl deacetylase